MAANMAEVQAEFDKMIESIGADDKKFKEVKNQLKELIAKGAKLAYKTGVFTDLIDRVQFAYPIWYLDNVESDQKIIDEIGELMHIEEFGTLQIIMRSAKYEYYITELIRGEFLNCVMSSNFRQLMAIPEIKEAAEFSIETDKDYQPEFDAILKSIYAGDTKLFDVKDKLDLMLLSGVRLDFNADHFSRILEDSNVVFGVWYLDNVKYCDELIDEIVEACICGCNSSILEIIMRCKKYKFYLGMIVKCDKLDKALRYNIKKLINQ
jgi:hypothetical protein